MRVILIAAMDPRGVIGRTRKPCSMHVVEGEVGAVCGTCGGEAGDPRTVHANELPWGRAYPEDLARFKELTMGHAVIAGRITAEGMGKAWPLKGRRSIVVSLSIVDRFMSTAQVGCPLSGSASICRTLDAAIRDARGHEKVYIGGGARLFAEALPIADELDLTMIGREWPGDVKFPMDQVDVDYVFKAQVGWRICPIGYGPLVWECTLRETCPTNAELTFTKWVRR